VCETIHVFFAVFCVVTAVYKSDFRPLLLTKHTTNDDQRKEDRAMIITVLTDFMFAPEPSLQVLRNCTHAVQVKCVLLSNRQYFVKRF
jgi:hypothetical protein